MLVGVLKDKNDLPEEFLDVLPETCPVCGSDMEITEGLTAVKCTNAVCPSKLTTRLVKLFEDLGVLGMGASRCAGMVQYHKATSPYIVFEVCHKDGTFNKFFEFYQVKFPDDTEPLILENTDKAKVFEEFSAKIAEMGYDEDECKLQHVEMSDKVAAEITSQVNKARTMLLYEFVRMGNYEGLRDSASQLFKDYGTLDEFYKDFENGGVAFVKNKLGIKVDNGVSIRAESIFNTLTKAKDELYKYIQYVDIRESAEVMNICISTAVGAPYKNKAEFVRVMNEKYGDRCYLNKLGSVSKNCQYLIWSKIGSETNKVQNAKKLGIPIMTGAEFDEMLRGKYGG